jgi:hypothetical protein
MSLCAVALGLPADFFQPFLDHSGWGVDPNWYRPGWTAERWPSTRYLPLAIAHEYTGEKLDAIDVT